MDDGARADRFVLLRGNVVGVVSHQYSPTKQFQVSLLVLHILSPFTSYTRRSTLGEGESDEPA